MSLTAQNVKFGLEENGEMLYLSAITVDGENVSYQLSADGQVFPNNEAVALLKLLRQSHPDENFIVIDADA